MATQDPPKLKKVEGDPFAKEPVLKKVSGDPFAQPVTPGKPPAPLPQEPEAVRFGGGGAARTGLGEFPATPSQPFAPDLQAHLQETDRFGAPVENPKITAQVQGVQRQIREPAFVAKQKSLASQEAARGLSEIAQSPKDAQEWAEPSSTPPLTPLEEGGFITPGQQPEPPAEGGVPMLDPRKNKVLNEYRNESEQQFSATEIADRRRAGTWGLAEDAREQTRAFLHQQQKINERAKRLRSTFDALGQTRDLKAEGEAIEQVAAALEQELAQLQQGEVTQQQADAFNAKVSLFQQKQKEYADLLRPINEESEYIQAWQQYVTQGLTDAKTLKNMDPRERMLLAKQFEADATDGGGYAGTIDRFFRRMGGNIAGLGLRTLNFVGNIPNRVTGSEDYYSPFAQLADEVDGALERIEAEKPKYQKTGIISDEWGVNPGFLHKMLDGALYAGTLAVAGASGGVRGMSALGIMGSSEDYYREGIDSGLKPQDAEIVALLLSSTEASIEALNLGPFVNGGARKSIMKGAVEAIKNGTAPRIAAKESFGRYVTEQMAGEGGEEVLTSVAQSLVKRGAEIATGVDQDTELTAKGLAGDALMGAAIGGVMGASGRMSQRPLYKEGVAWAVQNGAEFRQYVAENIPKAEQAQILERFEVYEKVYRGLPDNIKSDRRMTIAHAIAEKERLKKEQSNVTIDDTVAAAIGDTNAAGMKEQDEIIAGALGIDLVEVARKNEADRLREQYDKAKLKSEITGEPMPEGMKKPAEVKIEPKTTENVTVPNDGGATSGVANEVAGGAEVEAPAAAEANEEPIGPLGDAEDLDAVMASIPPRISESIDNTTTTAPTLTDDKAKNFLKSLVPGLTITRHGDIKSYGKALAAGGGKNMTLEEVAKSNGFYDQKTGQIHLSPNARPGTLAHEVMHPLVRAVLTKNPELLEKFWNEIKSDPDLNKVAGFSDLYRKAGRSEIEAREEAVVELLKRVSEGKYDAKFKDTGFLGKIKDFLRDILRKLGYKGAIDFSDVKNIKEFAGLVSRAMKTGATAKVNGNKPVTTKAEVSLQQDADRLVNGWYSRLDQAVAAKGSTMPGDQWLKWAEARAKEGALSMEEVKWTGLADFLAGKPKVTPQEVRAFLKDNRVKVEVKTLGVGAKYPDVDYEAEFGVRREDMTDDERENADADIERKYAPNTEFGQYQLPGGTNYREVLVTLPKREAKQQKEDTTGWRVETVREIPFTDQREAKVYDASGEWRGMSSATRLSDEELIDSFAKSNQASETREAERAINFKSSHFDEPNILVHLRVNDRTDADGKKVLFIEEVQSDWAQKGRKGGFGSPEELSRLREELKKAEAEYEQLDFGSMNLSEISNRPETLRLVELRGKIRAAEKAQSLTPSAPFVTSTDEWVELGMKQAIRMAVEGGYDKIAWTTGTQQNERYSLSKQIDNVEWDVQSTDDAADKTVWISPIDGKVESMRVMKDGTVIKHRKFEGKRLDEVIGKDLADKILKEDSGNLSGAGLDIGGTGMKGFYDKILPTVAKKVSKKLGGDGVVGEVIINPNPQGWKISSPDQTTHGQWMVKSSDYTSLGIRADTKEIAERVLAEKLAKTQSQQQSIAITPEMRAKVNDGVPLMQLSDDAARVAKALVSNGYNTKAKAREYLMSRQREDLLDGVMSEFDRIRSEQQKQKLVEPKPEPTPTPKKEPAKEAEEEGEGEKAMRATARRIKAQYPELGKALTPDGVMYERLPNSVSRKAANELIGYLGDAKAIAEVTNEKSDIPGAVRSMMFLSLMDKLVRDKDYTTASSLEESYVEQLTRAGQQIQAMADTAQVFFTPDMGVFKAKKEINRQRKLKMDRDKKHEPIRKGLEKVNEEAAEEAIKTIRTRKKVVTASTITEGAEPRPTKAGYGTRNKIVKKEAYERAWKELMGQLPAGIPHQLVTIAIYHIEAGSRTFAEVAEKVIKRGGKKLLPYLKGAYKEAAKQLEVEPTSDFDIDEFIAKANTDKVVAKFKAAQEKKDAKGQAKAIADLQQVAKENGVWGLYKDEAASRLKRMAEQTIKDDVAENAAVDDFTKGLVRNMTAKMKEDAAEAGREEKEPKQRRSDIQIIGDAYKNFEKYEEVWAKTQNEFQARLRAAEARLSKAETEEAKQEAKSAIEAEESKLEKLDAYFGDILRKPFNDKGIGRAVRGGMRELDQKIDSIIKQHYTVAEAAKRSLSEKLVQDAGLTGAQAEELAGVVIDEFNRIATERKRKVIDQYLSRKGSARTGQSKKTLEQELIQLTNAGAFSNDEFIEKYGDAMGWPTLTAENIAKIEELADRVQSVPEGRPRFEAVEDLLRYQANLAGVSKWELIQSVWYANMLSGYETHEVNAIANFAQVMMEAGVAAAQKPRDTKYIAKAIAYGLSRGFPEAVSTLKTGYSPIRGKVDIPAALERHKFEGVLKPYNVLKFVRRAMVAADVLFFETAKEMRAYQLAIKMARSEDPSQDVRQRALDIMNRGDDVLQSAKDQAQAEYEAELTEIENSKNGREAELARKKAKRDKGRRVFELVEKGRPENILTESAQFAARTTYNYAPEGALGAVANGLNSTLRAVPVLRYIIPFVNIIANVANESLNYYPPTGIARAISGGSLTEKLTGKKSKMSPEQQKQHRADLITKAAIGTALMTLAFVLSDPGDDDDPYVQITGNGYGDWKKNKSLEETGWRPYSIKIGNRWWSYQYTPLILVFGLVGAYRDAEKYRKEKLDDAMLTKFAVAFGRNTDTFFNQTFLTSIKDNLTTLMDASGEGTADKFAKSVARTAKALVLPNMYNQIARNIESAMDVPSKDVRGDILGEMVKDIPVLRDRNEDLYNALGEPVIPESRFLRRFQSPTDPDPVWNLAAEKGYAISAPHPGELTIVDPSTEEERVMTPAERKEFYVVRGQYIRQKVEKNYDKLESMSKKDFEEEMRSIQAAGTKKGKRAVAKID